jgi:hypothetical protein
MRSMPDYHISIMHLGFARRSVQHTNRNQLDPKEFTRT